MKLTKTEKYISKSGKVMTTGKIINYARNVLRIDNIHKDVFELIDFATKSLQQENARLRQVLKIKENDFQNLAKALEEIKQRNKNKAYAWDFSEKSDILNIHKNSKKVDGSAELGDFTIDFDKNGNIVGIEIMNVSEFIRHVRLSTEQLNRMQHAEIMVSKRKPSIKELKENKK